MFRQTLGSPVYPARACLALAFGLTLSVPLAWAQDRSPYERLDRLERDLNMLQRQVYRGAPVYAPDNGTAVNAQLRMDHLETEMRELTGRVEEYANRLEQLRRRLEQLNGDTERRFSQGAGPGSQSLAAAMPSPAADPARPARPARPPMTPEWSASNEDDRGQSPGGPIPIFGTLTPPGTPSGAQAATSPAVRPEPRRSNEPAAVAPPTAGNNAPPEGALPDGSATEQYNYAFGLIKQAKYPDAEAAFKEFVQAHPKDQMAGNAQYWLGETFYARGKYIQAASAFAEGYKRYPKSAKAADALLKLGMSLARADQKQNACVALAKLGEEFPQAASSVRQRAASEIKRLGC